MGSCVRAVLKDGDLTDAAEVGEWVAPPWLSELMSRFSRCAYLEADFWGGFGMQASLVWEQGRIASGPEISSGAINAALRRMGIDDGAPTILYGWPLIPGEDPFDMVGLGRHRSVGGWLQACAERATAPKGSPATPAGDPGCSRRHPSVK